MTIYVHSTITKLLKLLSYSVILNIFQFIQFDLLFLNRELHFNWPFSARIISPQNKNILVQKCPP